MDRLLAKRIRFPAAQGSLLLQVLHTAQSACTILEARHHQVTHVGETGDLLAASSMEGVPLLTSPHLTSPHLEDDDGGDSDDDNKLRDEQDPIAVAWVRLQLGAFA